MDAQNRTQMLKVLIAHGDPAQKAAALMQLAAAVMPAPPAAPAPAVSGGQSPSCSISPLTFPVQGDSSAQTAGAMQPSPLEEHAAETLPGTDENATCILDDDQD